jgi:glycosyltransferase involved in cell wall biosynthesis
LRELADEGSVDLDDVSIEFFGWPEEWLMHDVEKYHLEGVVAIHGLIPREEAILRQRSSQILLSLIWDHPAEKGVYTGKIFEYLAAKRPILSLGTPGGVVEDLLRVTHAGVHVSSFEELHQELITAYRAFKSTGEVPYHGIESEIDHFSHREMAGQFARVLDSINIVPL